MQILAADIGGTTSRFARFTLDREGLALSGRVRLPTGESASFASLLARLEDSGLGMSPARADAVVLGVPGPVMDGTYCDPPNIPWDIDLSGLDLPGPSLLVNDFVAQAWATRTEAVDGARVVQQGRAAPGTAVGVIGAGTGLGHCGLVPSGSTMAAVRSEFGHAPFPFLREERELQEFLLGHVDMDYLDNEDVVSGIGLARVCSFVTGGEADPREAARTIVREPEALALFARLYGRAARGWTLAILALGGLYVAGGVAARTPGVVTDPAFLAEFRAHPDYADMLAEVPIRLNANEDSGLWGAAQVARILLEGGA